MEAIRGVHYAIGNLRHREIYSPRKLFLSKFFKHICVYLYICVYFVFRFFPTVESYQKHVQLHQTNSAMSQKLPSSEFMITKIPERIREIKRDEQYCERSLKCPTCGKV